MYQGDSIEVMKGIPDNSIHFSIMSPPFSSLYVFSNNDHDLSNCKSHAEFFRHFRFFVKELYRVTMDGRLVAIHLMDLTTNIGRDGFLSVVDFRGMVIRLFQRMGWIYHNEITIWKNPVVEVTRTKNIQLLYRQFCKDAAISRTSLPDRLLVFRKPGENKVPVTHDTEKFKPNDWGKLASPVWMDINQTNTLNGREAREDEDERHISVLQLDVIERAVELWTNPGEIVFSGFAGVGSEGYQSIKMGRKFVGIELKPSYYEQAVKNLQSAVEQTKVKTLFDF